MNQNETMDQFTHSASHASCQAKKPVSKNKILVLAIVAVALMIVNLLLLIYAAQVMQARRAFDALSATVAAATPTTVPATAPATETTAATEETTVPTEPVVREILPQYAELYEENPELFGWIKIENTPIDYPVMHTPEEPEKYLYANFQADYSYSGTPFLDAACTSDSDNLLIYAHNMLDGSMFRNLLKYEQKDFWKRNPTITFNTLYEEQTFEVLAAFYDKVYLKTDTCFKFYQFIDAADEADYDNAIAEFKKKALYDTGVTAAWGDQLITLVTCAYHTDYGRFVVVARKTAEPSV